MKQVEYATIEMLPADEMDVLDFLFSRSMIMTTMMT